MLELAAIGRAALDHKHHDAENQLVQVFVHVVRAAADTAIGDQIWVIAIKKKSITKYITDYFYTRSFLLSI